MDTVHDLGGREGFGPVRWRDEDDNEAFHEDWEARAWAMVLCFLSSSNASWNLDWVRHAIERIEPMDYLTRPYYDRLVQMMMAVSIDDGIASLDEFVAGQSLVPAKVETGKVEIDGNKEGGETPPAYAIGDPVRAKMSIDANHTRRPGYTRGRTGVIAAHHGEHPLADANAQGKPRNEHLYTVAFKAADLWPEAEGRRERVFVDLWENYLESP